MRAHVLLNLLKEFRLRDKMQGCAKHFITFFAQNLIYSRIQQHEC